LLAVLLVVHPRASQLLFASGPFQLHTKQKLD
jgi:hypothetical protein